MLVRKKDFLLAFMNGFIIDLPAASNLYFLWNFGSMAGIILFFQILTGFFLSFHYNNNALLAFSSIIHIIRDVNMGWFFRVFHANGSSLFFLFIYVHICRSMVYGSYCNFKTWCIGVIMMLLTMGTGFLGYVLPWGQMSFWGATVITNMVSAVPYLGNFLVMWVWGGFSVDNPTLNRFFSFHFIFPFVILALTLIHLIYLHEWGSNNPLGLDSSSDKIYFHIYFSVKDIFGFVMYFFLFLYVILVYPYSMMDPENFIYANALVTPEHIQPEWYFLFAYTILRSVPSKLGGVIGLVMSVLILMFYGFLMNSSMFKSFNFYFLSKFGLSLLLLLFFILTWIGMVSVDYPYEKVGIMSTIFYFETFFLLYVLSFFQDLMLFNF
uniref:Cytochrome b n=1 Tax=Gnathostomula armata TaxID=231613 RepID=A0A0F6Q2U2_9BILA|nr:cytochrome b [Gnathostomula armata]AKD00027.1 cytochrome b [Gnathostomula armata]